MTLKTICIFLPVMLLGAVQQGFAQNEACLCKTDLIFLDSKIKKTPSYKKNKKAYEAAFTIASNKAEMVNSVYECYVLLNRLMLSINDNHSRAYGLDKGAIEEVQKDSIKFLAFRNSPLFNLYPKPNINLDSLTTVLRSKEVSDMEGIYHKKGLLTIGVFKEADESSYKAIVLDSETDVWVIGEIIYTLLPFGNGYLLNVGGRLSTKRLVTYTERIEDGFFLFTGFQKDLSLTQYSNELPAEDTYFRKELTSDITYIKVGSFSGWNPTLSQAEAFYQTLEGTLTKPHLIVDLRTNGGGGDRNSNALLKILKAYAKSNKVYVITNHITVSNAEQFAYKLSKFKNCQIFGHRTNGTLTYELTGSNYDLPCGNFMTVLTSKTHSAYSHLESVGVEPNVKLDMKSDWIDQIVDYIEEKN